MSAQPQSLVACSRMYNLGTAVRHRWDALFAHVANSADVALDVISHDAPAPLDELWDRNDLGLAFMCGLPFAIRESGEQAKRVLALAAPVALSPWAMGSALYASHIVMRADDPSAGFSDIADKARADPILSTLRWGWTVRDSQSGYHALRAWAASRKMLDPQHIRHVGQLIHPMGVLDALNSGVIDIGAVDSYAWALIKLHIPELLVGLKVIDTTQPTPCPLLIASGALAQETQQALQKALLSCHETAEGRGVLAALGLAKFAAVSPADYADLPARAARVDKALGVAW